MSEEPTPPRKMYQLKPKEFERVNTVIPGAPPPPVPGAAPDPGPQATEAVSRKIDVRELAQQAMANTTLLKGNAPANRANDVHAMLRDKYAHDASKGLYHVEAQVDEKRRARLWAYWTALVIVDTPFGALAWKTWPHEGMNQGEAILFTSAIAGIAMFTAWWTWHTWALRTER